MSSKMFEVKCSIVAILCLTISIHCIRIDPSCFQSSSSKRVSPADCCLIPKFYDSQMVSDCLTSITQSMNDVEKYQCLVECIAKKMNLFRGNTLDREVTKQLYRTKVGSIPHFAPIVDDVFEQCYNGMSVYAAQSNPTKCSVLPMMLLNCIQTRLFQNCPAKLWQGGSECQELKEKLLKGCPYAAIASF